MSLKHPGICAFELGGRGRAKVKSASGINGRVCTGRVRSRSNYGAVHNGCRSGLTLILCSRVAVDWIQPMNEYLAPGVR